MTANRRIFLNIVATYGRSLYALVIGLFCGRWTLMSLGQEDYGLWGVVGGLTVFISLLNSILAGTVGRFHALSVGASTVASDKCQALEEWLRKATTRTSAARTPPSAVLPCRIRAGRGSSRRSAARTTSTRSSRACCAPRSLGASVISVAVSCGNWVCEGGRNEYCDFDEPLTAQLRRRFPCLKTAPGLKRRLWVSAVFVPPFFWYNKRRDSTSIHIACSEQDN